MKWWLVYIFSFLASLSNAQEAYNACDKALELCPNTVYTVNNHQANKTLCNGCEDDFNYCFVGQNTIWLKFQTNANGGAISIQFSTVQFLNLPNQGSTYHAALIQANVPCNSVSYTQLGNCLSDVTGNQQINATNLAPLTTYYLVLSGGKTGAATLPAEFSLNVQLSGTAIDRPIPYINLGVSSTICANQTAAIMADRLHCEEPGNFRWFVNGTLFAESTNDSIILSSTLQTGDVISVETDCFSTCLVTVSNTLPPVTVTSVLADAGTDVTIREGETVQLQGAMDIHSIVEWSPSYSLNNPYIRYPIANPLETTTYMMAVTDTISGCTAYDYVTVFVDKSLFIPNTFSPNNDGENDTWVILGIEKYPDCQVSIYDRWGQPVFYSTGYPVQKAWNGEGKIGKLNEGVYFYAIELNDADKQTLKGTITLIR